MAEERRDDRERREQDEGEDVEGHRKSRGAADEPKSEGEGEREDEDVEAHRHHRGRHSRG